VIPVDELEEDDHNAIAASEQKSVKQSIKR